MLPKEAFRYSNTSFDLHEILFEMQFGFRSGHSTDHALISLTERIKCTLDSNRIGYEIFIDLQKAFDTVNHQFLQ